MKQSPIIKISLIKDGVCEDTFDYACNTIDKSELVDNIIMSVNQYDIDHIEMRGPGKGLNKDVKNMVTDLSSFLHIVLNQADSLFT